MEGGAITLELTFREAILSPGAPLPRSGSRSPKPRTGWYRSSRRVGRSPSASPAGEWASTDADQQSLRWHQVGTADIPALGTCVLLPWVVGDVAACTDKGEPAAQQADGTDWGCTDSPWTELGVYPPGDDRKRRQALLMGFHAVGAESASATSGGEGYVVALLVEAGARGGVTVIELCRAPLEEGHEPVAFNREKLPSGTPASGRAAAEAVCADGWVRRWYVASRTAAARKEGGQASGGAVEAGEKWSRFAVRRVDLCRPFRNGGADASGGSPASINSSAVPAAAATITAPLPDVELIAVASPSLLAIARRLNPQGATDRSTGRSRSLPSLAGVGKAEEQSSDATNGVAASSLPDPPPIVEVWSCSTAPYPRSQFRKEGPVALRGFRDGQTIEGMCWVTPEAGDERGAAVGGHCLCVSVGGTVIVLARERRERPPVDPGMLTVAELGGDGIGDRSEWIWSPIFRVANPCSLLTCHTAGLRDFCQVSGGLRRLVW